MYEEIWKEEEVGGVVPLEWAAELHHSSGLKQLCRWESKASGRQSALARTEGDPVRWQQVVDWFVLSKKAFLEKNLFGIFISFYPVDISGLK